ncbi:hypothetical protein Tco_1357226, partial [Tanacetum coccineum]
MHSELADIPMVHSHNSPLDKNDKRIQVKDIVKEVKDHLKTYSSDGIDISWYVKGIRCGSKESQEEQAELNLVDTMPTATNPVNATTTINVSQSVVDENLPQLLDSRRGSHVTSVPLTKRILQVGKLVIKCKTAKEMWNDLILVHKVPSNTKDTKIAALRLKFNAFKSLEGEKVNGTFTRLKCLLNDLENNGIIIPQVEVNAMFLTARKWLSMNQTQRANNSINNDCLATLY